MFYGCSSFNQNLSSWNVSLVTNMTSMFENASLFNNNNIPMRWNCSNNLSANNFGYNSALYGNILNYTPNFGYAVRSNNNTSIQTPSYSLNGLLKYSFINTGLQSFSNFDMSKIPIINSSNSFNINVTQDISGNLTTVNVRFNCITINDNDGFSFKNVASYYGSNRVTILQFSSIVFSKLGEQFKGLSYLDISANDTPSILQNTSLEKAFYNSTYFNSNINNWNVSGVNNMSSMFYGCSSFNQNIGSWSVSNVNNMSSMFYGSSNFNSNINNWNVSHVNNMSSMFQDCSNFNQNLSSWNVSLVTNMSSMFQGCSIFNQNLSGWNVSLVTNMSSMFQGCSIFNQNLSDWNVSLVTNMNSMFQNATIFNNNNIPMNWNCNTTLSANNFGDGTALYTNTNNDYRKNAGNAKRQTTSGINKSIQTPIYNYGTFIYTTDNLFNLTYMSSYLPIIKTADTLKIYNESINDNSNIRTVRIPFYYDSIAYEDGLSFKNCNILYRSNNIINTVNITQFDGIPLSNNTYQFANLAKLTITATDRPSILQNTSLERAFYQCTNFNADLSNWNVSEVTNMDSMFQDATKFNNKGIPMFWNCASLTTAKNFGLNSNLYGVGGNYNINPGNAVRFSTNNIDYYSIETNTNNTKYQLTTRQKTNLTSLLKSGTFVYSFDNTGTIITQLIFNMSNPVQSFNEFKQNYLHEITLNLPIINSTSFTKLIPSIKFIGNITTVTVVFEYKIILGNDGLNFNNVSSYYKKNLITITDFDGIPLSNTNNVFQNTPIGNLFGGNHLSDNKYVFQKWSNVNLVVTSSTCPVITEDLPSNLRIYFNEINTPDIEKTFDKPHFCNKMSVFLVGAGGSGGAGADDDEDGRIRNGKDGSGGGGGEYRNIDISNNTFIIKVGKGGLSVKGSSNGWETWDNGTQGKNGNAGGNTILTCDGNSYYAEGGKEGGGGVNNRREGYRGIGGKNGIGGVLLSEGKNSGGRDGAESGYYSYMKINSNSNRLGYFSSSLGNNFGNGGNGTKGVQDFRWLPTGSGKDGYARVYFIT